MFRILKAQWRILKIALRLMSLESVDQVWLTCCALHNWLLEIYAYDVEYGGVIQCSNPSFSEFTIEDVSFALDQLDKVSQPDLSWQGVGHDMNTGEDAEDEDKEETTNTNVVHTPKKILVTRVNPLQ